MILPIQIRVIVMMMCRGKAKRKVSPWKKEILKEKGARKKLQRELNEIRARNEDAHAEVVSARNDYPVLFVNVNGLLITV